MLPLYCIRSRCTICKRNKLSDTDIHMGNGGDKETYPCKCYYSKLHKIAVNNGKIITKHGHILSHLTRTSSN